MKKTIVAAALLAVALGANAANTLGHYVTKNYCLMELTDEVRVFEGSKYPVAKLSCNGQVTRFPYTNNNSVREVYIYANGISEQPLTMRHYEITAGAVPQYDPETMRDILQAELIGQSVARNLRRNSW